MWVNHVILALMGLFAGFAVSAGTFAFLIAIGVIPRLIGKSNTARAVFSYETMILLGNQERNRKKDFHRRICKCQKDRACSNHTP